MGHAISKIRGVTILRFICLCAKFFFIIYPSTNIDCSGAPPSMHTTFITSFSEEIDPPHRSIPASDDGESIKSAFENGETSRSTRNELLSMCNNSNFEPETGESVWNVGSMEGEKRWNPSSLSSVKLSATTRDNRSRIWIHSRSCGENTSDSSTICLAIIAT